MLVIKNLYWKEVLKNVNLTLSNNTILGIYGNSGIGKTSFLKCIKNLYNDWEGSITLNGQNISKYDKSIGFILQENGLFPYKTLYENLLLVNENVEQINNYIKKFHLEKFINLCPSSLSGGQKQRTLIIRTLLQNPNIILMDEPTSALDESNIKILKHLIDEVKENKIIIIVSHHFEFLNNITDKVVNINDLSKS